MKRRKTVLVAVSSAHAASRQKLRGIYRYAARKDDWDIALVRSSEDLTRQFLAECANGEIDGFILSSDECSANISHIVPIDKPIVAIEVGTGIDPKRNPGNTIILTTDNVAIGKMAAEHFRSLGRFASFVYIPDEMNRNWSSIRGEAFMKAVSSNHSHIETYDDSKETLTAFLSRQMRPVAVFAAWDFLAAKTIRACHEAKLSVPSQVSVLGVDDDDLVCESVRPPLSTILVDRITQGTIAAKTLDAMMDAPRRVKRVNYVCHPLKVVQRESTIGTSPGDVLVDRAVRFIHDNAMSNISVKDVAEAIGVSRRLLDLRFAESGFGSASKNIHKARISVVKQQLKQTSLSESRIAASCGFTSVGALRNQFRRVCGMSMSAYRQTTGTI
jgi:LacI family transcriptional regulator